MNRSCLRTDRMTNLVGLRRALAGVTSCLLLTAASDQSAQPRRLGAPVTELGELSGSVRQVRELRDGRVIVSQSGESPLLVVDSAFRRVTTLGRRGAGPGEYLNPSTIFERGDTIWIVDGTTRRLTSLAMDLELLASISLQSVFARDSLIWSVPLGIDERGRFLVRTQHMRDLGRLVQNQDSISLFWLDRKTPGPTLLARLRQVPIYSLRGIRVSPSNDTTTSLAIDPFTTDDAAALALDGRAVVLRASPYRLEWPSASGKPVVGPTIEYQKIEITGVDRAAVQRAHTQVRASLQRQVEQSSSRTKIEWAESRWPPVKPPFVGSVRSTPRGELVVQSLRPAAKADTALYDFLSSRTGRRVFQLDLGIRGRLVGIGANYLYVIRLDDDDIEYLGRYRY